MENQQKDVVMVIADISGYTRFMTCNRKSLAHAQVIITELMTSLIDEIQIPLRVIEIEGDAIFFIGVEESELFPWEQVVTIISKKLPAFFNVFYTRLHDLLRSNMCHCNACDSASDLKLKIIAHIGEAVFYDIASFSKLSGPDVILIHRLLKNSIKADEYLLMTETAFSAFNQSQKFDAVKKIENVNTFGKIPLFVHYPHLLELRKDSAQDGHQEVSFYKKLKQTMKIGMNGMLIMMGIKRGPKFRNLPKI